MTKVLIIENGYEDLKKSRKPLGEYIQSFGNEVCYACPNPKEEMIHTIPMSRNSLAPIQLIKGYKSLNNLESNYYIEAVLSFRFIPNVLNYMASFRNRQIQRVAVITGLGYAFISTNTSIRFVIQRALIKWFYRIASNRIHILAQNPNDLIDLGVKNGEVVLGSGIKDFDKNTKKTLVLDSIKLLYVGRLLKSKGIDTAIEIFKQLRSRNSRVTLTIAGEIDKHNPDSLTDAELVQLKNQVGVNYLGFVSNIDSVYAECNVLLFPSTYREGVPRVILESLKTGLTIVTRDMPGCKETVIENGFLMKESHTTEQVVDYLFSLTPSMLLENQKKSVELFKSKFCSEVIYPQYLEKLK